MEKLQLLWESHRTALVLTVAAAILGFAVIRQHTVQQPLLAVGTSPAPEAETVTVDVEGAVAAPGLRELPVGSLVEDALTAAGGFTDDVDDGLVAKQLNRADKLKPGQKVYVPGKSATSSSGPGDTSALVNLNAATEAELEALPGIGPTTAQKIIAYRESRGSFTTTEELKDVPGIGDAKFDQLKDLVTV